MILQLMDLTAMWSVVYSGQVTFTYETKPALIKLYVCVMESPVFLGRWYVKHIQTFLPLSVTVLHVDQSLNMEIYIYISHSLKKGNRRVFLNFFFFFFTPAVFVKEEPGISDCTSVVEMYIYHMCWS